MTTLTDTQFDDGRPARFDPAATAVRMSDGLAEWATGLLAVPMLTTVAYARSDGETCGSVLCRVLEHKCVHTLDEVVRAIPGIFDASGENHPAVVGALELIEARADELLGQALGLAEAA